MNKLFKLIAAAGLVAFSEAVAQAQPYYIVGDVVNGWSDPGAIQLTGGPTVYSYTVTGGTPGAYEQLKITAGGWGSSFTGNNVQVKLDANGNNTIYAYPGTIVDGWTPVQNRVGYADPGNMAWEIAGDFTNPNWASDPSAQLGAAGNGVYTNVYIVPTAGTHNFKFRTPNTWNEVNFGADFGNGSANATFTTTNANQKVLFQLDLPHGRWLAGAPAPAPVTNSVVFAVDMSSQITLGLFHPGYSVFVSGGFNGWAGTGSGALLLNNVPAYNGGQNTNIYYGTNVFVGAPGSSPSEYKFTDNDPALPSGDNGYEQAANRVLTLANASGPELLPVVSFGNQFVSDLLSADAPVFFSVDMANAVGTDGHAFDSTQDSVYVNGQFPAWYAWGSGVNPAPAPAGFQLFEQGFTTIYTNTITIPAGSPVNFQYKYGIDAGSQVGGPADDEAGINANHLRVLRSTAIAPYVLPQDTFGNQYVEPFFNSGSTADGNLHVGAPVSGAVAVTWLGRPGAHLQSSASLTSGVWQDLPATDGTNWLNGYNSTNGFVSQTNWPANGAAFFRLVKP